MPRSRWKPVPARDRLLRDRMALLDRARALMAEAAALRVEADRRDAEAADLVGQAEQIAVDCCTVRGGEAA